ncbi:GIY-YIG nuclease family protein [Chamaesiphon sp.]|uniref:GIY-YIG nuclease family protein n=1 Tax=Chamaesiphon sp. TaxID=2814140 RepID=UPI0035943ABB
MNIGYLYALTNRAFDNSLIKIGHTTKEPNIRAKEISSNTGVPEPFDIAFAFKVYDCKEAETIIHKKLKAYRNNNKREFFIMTIDVARELILKICRVFRIEYASVASDTV